MPRSVTSTKDPEVETPEVAAPETASDGEGPTAEEAERVKQHRTPPTYLAEEVDEFPEQEEFARKGGVGRESIYINLMTDIAKNKRGKKIRLTHFVTGNSAQDVVNAFCGYTDRKGEYHEPTRVVPIGNLEDWVFKAIRVPNPDTKDDPVKQGRPFHSELFVQYVGPEISD